jgi:VanZ family protein
MLGSLRHPWLWQVLGWGLVIGATVASLLPRTPMPQIPSGDKVLHLLTYAVLAAWFAGLYPRARYVWIAALLFFMGLAIEWAQGAMDLGRHRDYHDVIANSLGIGAGLTLAWFWLGNWAQRIEAWTRRS